MRHLHRLIAGRSVIVRIAWLIAALSAPFVMMTWLFVAGVREDTGFAAKELEGTRQLAGLWPALVAAAGADPDAAAAAAPAVGPDGAGWGAADPAVAAFAAALGPGGPAAAALEAGRAAMRKAADASNLTLDPDLDSYYLMDAAAIRLPEALAAAAALREAAAAAGPAPGGLAAHGALIRAAARFGAAEAAVRASLGSAAEAGADGAVRAAVGPALARFEGRAAALGAAADALLGGDLAAPAGAAPSAVAAPVAAAEATLRSDVDALWAAANAELARLLEARIDRLTAGAARRLGAVAACVAVAAGLAALVVVSIRRPLRHLVGVIRRFEAGDYGAEVGPVGAADEIGEIARSLRSFRAVGAGQKLTVAAIDASPALVMITDPGERVAFVSLALVELLRSLEPAFRAADPGFAAHTLVGRHLDAVRANPALAGELLGDDGRTRKLRYGVGGRTILVDVTHVRAADGEVLGHSLQWRDVTDATRAERDIAELVAAARAGDFTRRVPMDDKWGMVRTLAGGLNDVLASVDRAAGEFGAALARLARGDLTAKVEGGYGGRLDELKGSLNGAAVRLAGALAPIQAATAEIGTAAVAIDAGAEDLAARTERQAASLEETAATAEGLAASVRQSAERSGEAARLAREAKAVSERGTGTAAQAEAAMGRIEAASAKIADIVGIIDGIAFRTNLLALNAAVEAARAGDAGRGFAVVASEVRTLAQRSAEAAKDIKRLVANSGEQVAGGVALVRQAGDALREITAAAQRVADTVGEISSGAREQAHAIGEVTQAVAHMDGMTQENAGLADGSAASARTLTARVAELRELVGFFTTGEGAGAAAPSPAPSRPPEAAPRAKPRLRAGRATAGVGARASA